VMAMDMNPIAGRRRLLRAGFSLSTLGVLGGCNLTDNEPVQKVLTSVSRFNDRVQAAIFRPDALAPEFAKTAAVKDFRYNAWYGADLAPKLQASDYRLQLSGLVANKRPWTVDDLYAILQRIGADTTAKYVGFECADGYYEGLDMPTAMHPQTLMAFRLADEILPTKYGYPFKIRVPTKLGFKNPKFITTIFVTNKEPRGFWTDRGYNWFSGI